MTEKSSKNVSEELNSNEKERQSYVRLVKKLRDETQLSFADCKQAIEKANGDEQLALIILRNLSLNKAISLSHRKTKSGSVFSHIVRNKKDLPDAGVLLELCCETDFVSKSPEFLMIGKKLAFHIYENRPLFTYLSDVPKESWENAIRDSLEVIKRKHPNYNLETQTNLAKQFAEEELKETILMSQKLDGTPDLTVSEYLNNFIGLFRENIKISRFILFEI
jgi:elongation factor Ts